MRFAVTVVHRTRFATHGDAVEFVPTPRAIFAHAPHAFFDCGKMSGIDIRFVPTFQQRVGAIEVRCNPYAIVGNGSRHICQLQWCNLHFALPDGIGTYSQGAPTGGTIDAVVSNDARNTAMHLVDDVAIVK